MTADDIQEHINATAERLRNLKPPFHFMKKTDAEHDINQRRTTMLKKVSAFPNHTQMKADFDIVADHFKLSPEARKVAWDSAKESWMAGSYYRSIAYSLGHESPTTQP